jgi:polyisoprenoid-binding protein YceI
MILRSCILASTALIGGIGFVALSPTAQSRTTADSFTVDPVHSTVIFRVKHLNTSYSFGRFNDISGTVTWDDANPSSGGFDLTVKTDSISTNSDKRDAHLKSPDFFNAAQFPTCAFKAKSIAKGAGENVFDLSGDLTMHGVTKPITAKLEKTGANKNPRGEIIGFESTFTVKRSDFGINYMPDGLGDEVRIIVSIEAKK